MAGVPASSHGGGLALTGGTLTGALEVDPAAGGSDAFVIHADPTDVTNTHLVVDRYGNLRIDSGGSHQEATIHLADNTAGNPGGIDLDTYTGVNIGIEASAQTHLILTPGTGHTGKLFQAKSTLGAVVTEIPVTGGIKTAVVTSGALATVAPSSGVAFQCSTSRDVFLCVPFTGDATNNAATLLIQLSPDNVTFSTLDTLSIAAALNLSGAINVPVSLAVPGAWYVKLTASHGAIGTATYY